MNDPYVLFPKDEDGHQKDSKTSRCWMYSLTFYSGQRCRSTPSHTLGPSPTSAHPLPRPLPIAPNQASTSVSTQGPSPMVVISVGNPPASSLTSSSTPKSTPGTSRTNVYTQAVRKPHTTPTFWPAGWSTTVTRCTQLQPHWRGTCPHMQ